MRETFSPAKSAVARRVARSTLPSTETDRSKTAPAAKDRSPWEVQIQSGAGGSAKTGAVMAAETSSAQSREKEVRVSLVTAPRSNRICPPKTSETVGRDYADGSRRPAKWGLREAFVPAWWERLTCDDFPDLCYSHRGNARHVGMLFPRPGGRPGSEAFRPGGLPARLSREGRHGARAVWHDGPDPVFSDA